MADDIAKVGATAGSFGSTDQLGTTPEPEVEEAPKFDEEKADQMYEDSGTFKKVLGTIIGIGARGLNWIAQGGSEQNAAVKMFDEDPSLMKKLEDNVWGEGKISEYKIDDRGIVGRIPELYQKTANTKKEGLQQMMNFNQNVTKNVLSGSYNLLDDIDNKLKNGEVDQSTAQQMTFGIIKDSVDKYNNNASEKVYNMKQLNVLKDIDPETLAEEERTKYYSDYVTAWEKMHKNIELMSDVGNKYLEQQEVVQEWLKPTDYWMNRFGELRGDSKIRKEGMENVDTKITQFDDEISSYIEKPLNLARKTDKVGIINVAGEQTTIQALQGNIVKTKEVLVDKFSGRQTSLQEIKNLRQQIATDGDPTNDKQLGRIDEQIQLTEKLIDKKSQHIKSMYDEYVRGILDGSIDSSRGFTDILEAKGNKMENIFNIGNDLDKGGVLYDQGKEFYGKSFKDLGPSIVFAKAWENLGKDQSVGYYINQQRDALYSVYNYTEGNIGAGIRDTLSVISNQGLKVFKEVPKAFNEIMGLFTGGPDKFYRTYNTNIKGAMFDINPNLDYNGSNMGRTIYQISPEVISIVTGIGAVNKVTKVTDSLDYVGSLSKLGNKVGLTKKVETFSNTVNKVTKLMDEGADLAAIDKAIINSTKYSRANKLISGIVDSALDVYVTNAIFEPMVDQKYGSMDFKFDMAINMIPIFNRASKLVKSKLGKYSVTEMREVIGTPQFIDEAARIRGSYGDEYDNLSLADKMIVRQQVKNIFGTLQAGDTMTKAAGLDMTKYAEQRHNVLNYMKENPGKKVSDTERQGIMNNIYPEVRDEIGTFLDELSQSKKTPDPYIPVKKTSLRSKFLENKMKQLDEYKIELSAEYEALKNKPNLTLVDKYEMNSLEETFKTTNKQLTILDTTYKTVTKTTPVEEGVQMKYGKLFQRDPETGKKIESNFTEGWYVNNYGEIPDEGSIKVGGSTISYKNEDAIVSKAVDETTGISKPSYIIKYSTDDGNEFFNIRIQKRTSDGKPIKDQYYFNLFFPSKKNEVKDARETLFDEIAEVTPPKGKEQTIIPPKQIPEGYSKLESATVTPVIKKATVTKEQLPVMFDGQKITVKDRKGRTRDLLYTREYEDIKSGKLKTYLNGEPLTITKDNIGRLTQGEPGFKSGGTFFDEPKKWTMVVGSTETPITVGFLNNIKFKPEAVEVSADGKLVINGKEYSYEVLESIPANPNIRYTSNGVDQSKNIGSDTLNVSLIDKETGIEHKVGLVKTVQQTPASDKFVPGRENEWNMWIEASETDEVTKAFIEELNTQASKKLDNRGMSVQYSYRLPDPEELIKAEKYALKNAETGVPNTPVDKYFLSEKSSTAPGMKDGFVFDDLNYEATKGVIVFGEGATEVTQQAADHTFKLKFTKNTLAFANFSKIHEGKKIMYVTYSIHGVEGFNEGLVVAYDSLDKLKTYSEENGFVLYIVPKVTNDFYPQKAFEKTFIDNATSKGHTNIDNILMLTEKNSASKLKGGEYLPSYIDSYKANYGDVNKLNEYKDTELKYLDPAKKTAQDVTSVDRRISDVNKITPPKNIIDTTTNGAAKYLENRQKLLNKLMGKTDTSTVTTEDFVKYPDYKAEEIAIIKNDPEVSKQVNANKLTDPKGQPYKSEEGYMIVSKNPKKITVEEVAEVYNETTDMVDEVQRIEYIKNKYAQQGHDGVLMPDGETFFAMSPKQAIDLEQATKVDPVQAKQITDELEVAQHQADNVKINKKMAKENIQQTSMVAGLLKKIKEGISNVGNFIMPWRPVDVIPDGLRIQHMNFANWIASSEFYLIKEKQHFNKLLTNKIMKDTTRTNRLINYLNGKPEDLVKMNESEKVLYLEEQNVGDMIMKVYTETPIRHKELTDLGYIIKQQKFDEKILNKLSVAFDADEPALYQFVKQTDETFYQKLVGGEDSYVALVGNKPTNYNRTQEAIKTLANDNTVNRVTKTIQKILGGMSHGWMLGTTLLHPEQVVGMLFINGFGTIVDEMVDINKLGGRKLGELNKIRFSEGIFVDIPSAETLERGGGILERMKYYFTHPKNLAKKGLDMVNQGMYNSYEMVNNSRYLTSKMGETLIKDYHIFNKTDRDAFTRNMKPDTLAEFKQELMDKTIRRYTYKTGNSYNKMYKIGYGSSNTAMGMMYKVAMRPLTLMSGRGTQHLLNAKDLVNGSFAKKILREVIDSNGSIDQVRKAIDDIYSKNIDRQMFNQKLLYTVWLGNKLQRVIDNDITTEDTIEERWEDITTLGSFFHSPLQSLTSTPTGRILLAGWDAARIDDDNEEVDLNDMTSASTVAFGQYLKEIGKRFIIPRSIVGGITKGNLQKDGEGEYFNRIRDTFREATAGFGYFIKNEVENNGFEVSMPYSNIAMARLLAPGLNKYKDEFKEASLEKKLLMLETESSQGAWKDYLVYRAPFKGDILIGTIGAGTDVEELMQQIYELPSYNNLIAGELKIKDQEYGSYVFDRLVEFNVQGHSQGNATWTRFENFAKGYKGRKGNIIQDLQGKELFAVANLVRYLGDDNFTDFWKEFSMADEGKDGDKIKRGTQLLAFVQAVTDENARIDGGVAPMASRELISSLAQDMYYHYTNAYKKQLGLKWDVKLWETNPEIDKEVKTIIAQKLGDTLFITDKDSWADIVIYDARENLKDTKYVNMFKQETYIDNKTGKEKKSPGAVTLNFEYGNDIMGPDGKPLEGAELLGKGGTNRKLNAMYKAEVIMNMGLSDGTLNGYDTTNMLTSLLTPNEYELKEPKTMIRLNMYARDLVDLIDSSTVNKQRKTELKLGVANFMIRVIDKIEPRTIQEIGEKDFYKYAEWIWGVSKDAGEMAYTMQSANIAFEQLQKGKYSGVMGWSKSQDSDVTPGKTGTLLDKYKKDGDYYNTHFDGDDPKARWNYTTPLYNEFKQYYQKNIYPIRNYSSGGSGKGYGYSRYTPHESNYKNFYLKLKDAYTQSILQSGKGAGPVSTAFKLTIGAVKPLPKGIKSEPTRPTKGYRAQQAARPDETTRPRNKSVAMTKSIFGRKVIGGVATK